MKPVITFSIVCLIAVLIFSGCGKSNEQIKKVGALQLELFQMQQQLYSKMSELNKFSWQIEALANRKDQIAMSMANDIHATQALITEVYKASEDEGMQPTVQNNAEEMMKKLGESIDKLKNTIDKTSIAIIKSRDVILEYKKREK
jgi:preprotein translocase subunit SecF